MVDDEEQQSSGSHVGMTSLYDKRQSLFKMPSKSSMCHKRTKLVHAKFPGIKLEFAKVPVQKQSRVTPKPKTLIKQELQELPIKSMPTKKKPVQPKKPPPAKLLLSKQPAPTQPTAPPPDHLLPAQLVSDVSSTPEVVNPPWKSDNYRKWVKKLKTQHHDEWQWHESNDESQTGQWLESHHDHEWQSNEWSGWTAEP